MYRFFAATIFSVAVLHVSAGTAFAATTTETVRGTIASITNCYPSGFAITVSGTSTSTLIYQATAVYPQGSTPTVGQNLIALAKDATTCDTDPGTGTTLISGKSSTYIAFLASVATTTPPVTPPPASNPGDSDSGSSLLDPIKGILGNILGSNGVGTAAGSAVAGALGTAAGSIAGGVPFGGPITLIQRCETPVGGLLVTLGPPTPGLYLYIPGYSFSYLNGPPAYPGQFLLGNADGPQPCDVCLGQLYCPIPGLVINNRPGHGSSGPTPTLPPPPPEEEPDECEEVTAKICAATNAYIGADTSASHDPELNRILNNGRLSCVYAVNNVLSNAGVRKIDRYAVISMEAELIGGRGKAISKAEAKCGDIVIEGKARHVGICLDAGCTRVVSNSSGRAEFNWFSGTDFLPSYGTAGRIYRVQCTQ